MNFFLKLLTFLVTILIIFGCNQQIEESIGVDNSNFKDTTPPTISDLTVDNIQGRSFTLKLKTNENSTVYYSVQLLGTEKPDVDKITSGTNGVIYGNFTILSNILKEENISSDLLNPETDYKIYLYAKDSSGNKSEIKEMQFKTQPLDTIPPSFTTKELVSKTETTANFNIIIDKNGKIYYIIVAKDSTSPTPQQVKDGNNYSSVIVVNKGSSNNNITTYQINATGLTQNTEYDLYVVAENTENPPALSTTPDKVTFKTLSDTDQLWTTDKQPKVGTADSDITDTSIKIFLAVQKTGKIYAVALPKGTTPSPSATQVMNGQDGNNNPITPSGRIKSYVIDSSNVNIYKYLNLTELSSDTEYDIYATAGTGTNGDQGVIDPPAKLTAKTDPADMTPPEWKSGTPKYDTITDNSFKFYTGQNKLGKIYVIVVPSGSETPTSEQVKAQTNYGSVTLIYNYTKTVNTIDYEYTQTITGLTSGTTYDVYSVGESSQGVLMAVPDKKTVTTTGTPPAPAQFESITPANGTTDVSLNPSITITFTQNLNTTVKGTVNFNGSDVTPDNISVSGKNIIVSLTGLSPNTTYTGISLSNFKDALNNDVNWSDLSYSFTTGNSSSIILYATGFENVTKSSYATANETIDGKLWELKNCLKGDLSQDYKEGSKSIRMKDYDGTNGNGTLTLLEDINVSGNITIKFNYARYSTDDSSATKFVVEYSTDSGTTWAQLGNEITTTPNASPSTFQENFTNTGNIRIRIRSTTNLGKRYNIDNLEIKQN